MTYPQSDDCEDQGMSATKFCAQFQCIHWEYDLPIYPRLIKRGKFWCCPKCGASYGADAHG